MLTKRIIPCLDVKDGRTVKGVNFVNLRDAGDAVELAQRYAEEGADELVFLDITATVERRKTLAELVRRVAQVLTIPFTVGGGISSVDDVALMLENGADKVSVNSAALRRPDLLNEISQAFGAQCLVLAIDTNYYEDEWRVFSNGGRTPTAYRLLDWAREGEQRGAGEILLTSMAHDGTKNGFACALTAAVAEATSLPIIASGGAGKAIDFAEVFTTGRADAGLAASIFHFQEIKIGELKAYLHAQGLAVRH